MESQLLEKDGVRIAIEGCGHGTLHSIYASVEAACKIHAWDGVDLLIIGGDFQAVRNALDLNCMSVPMKYRAIGDFHSYYSGARTAPYLTVFVGGNHEASNYLFELYYGGWVAPNIYYLGAANVLRIGPLRIAGLSGIWKGYNYRKTHHERLPYNEDDVKSAYHVREIDVRKLLQIKSQVDIGISHDWPRGIEWKGDHQGLFKRKDHFRQDAETGQLGSVAAKYVMDRLRPRYWFSAHLHIKYTAMVDHNGEVGRRANGDGTNGHIHATKSVLTAAKNEAEIDLDLDEDVPDTAEPSAPDADEIDLDMDEVDTAPVAPTSTTKNDEEISLDVDGDSLPNPAPVSEDLRSQLPAAFSKPESPSTPEDLAFPADITNKVTQFLALDKCLPNRDFLQILDDIHPLNPSSVSGPYNRPLQLEYDPEWLAITRAFSLAEPLQVGERAAQIPPDRGTAYYSPLIEDAMQWVDQHIISARKSIVVPQNFQITAPTYTDGEDIMVMGMPREYSNNQTQDFCEMIGIQNVFHLSEEEALKRQQSYPPPSEGGGREFGGGRGRGRGGFRGGRGRGHGRGRGGGRGGGRGRGQR